MRQPVRVSATVFMKVTRASRSVEITASPIERSVVENQRSRSRRRASISWRYSATSTAERSSLLLIGLTR